ncbi:hypothetical protein NC653_035240 [Populus alba x Populus x berolinensis]|uniref:Transmembrane protein n=1 Tax=Populus alba x Populus x berolinensis TaxID=444605 RepID=A0AAD6LQ07_9ROSI|nr:hypothetical protein NC653_035240 [Populus alba x Populus x berolinensis]
MNSAKVIKLPSCCSPFLQKKLKTQAKFLLQGRWKELNIPGTGEIKTMVMLTSSSAIYVLLPNPLSFFSSVLLSSFLLCSALLSLSSPHCLVVFPPFVLSFFLSFFSLSRLPPSRCAVLVQL